MSYLGQDVNPVTPTDVAVNGTNLGGVPLFSVQWWPNRSSIPSGYVPGDGQELSQSIYPDANNGIAASMVPLVIEATWQSTPTERGKYVAVSSTGKFRVPDYNGKSAGSLGALVLRGDGALSAAVNGVIQQDQMQGFAVPSISSTTPVDVASSGTPNRYSTNPATRTPVTDGTNGTPRLGSETRPLNVTGCWIIKLFGAVINPGAFDVSKLVAAYNTQQIALTALLSIPPPLGHNQTYQNLLATRAFGTTYTNTTGRPIQVAITGYNGTGVGVLGLYVDAIQIVALQCTESNGATYQGTPNGCTFIVPAGSTYSASVQSGTVVLRNWCELR